MQQTTFQISDGDNKYYFDEFIISKANITGYKTITNWPLNWGVKPYDKALIIIAPKSSGKTYLAKIWAKDCGAKFINHDDELSTTIINQHQGFIIEDLHNICDEQKILHYFNMLHEHNKYLLITSRADPQIKLPDLSSRINSINRILISKPDDELIRLLIFKLFSNYSIVVPNDVINYLITIIPREFDKIIKYTSLINQYALQNKRKVTIPLIKKVVEKYLLNL